MVGRTFGNHETLQPFCEDPVLERAVGRAKSL